MKKHMPNSATEVKTALDKASTNLGAYARPKDIDVVFKPWKEWHALTEDLKEAKRLLNGVLTASEKGQPIDRGQIEGFLK